MNAHRTRAIVALVLVLVLGFSRSAFASEEDAVRSIIARETAAWKTFDPAKVAALYTRDAIWQNPFGVRFYSSADLQNLLVRLFNRPGFRAAKDTSKAKIMDLRFPAPDVAVVWSEESSEGQIDDSTGKPMLPRHSSYMQVLVKRDGSWKISDCIIMDKIQHSKS